MSDNDKPRYDHIDPAKLKTAEDRAVYDALVGYVDSLETDKTKGPKKLDK